MATFPNLNTGAVAQYPMTLGTGQAVQIVRFLDGSEQRFLHQGRQFRRWHIDLSQLTSKETSAIEDFFEQQSGEFGLFSFPDPYSQTEVPNCRIGSSEFQMEVSAISSVTTNFWVVETNG